MKYKLLKDFAGMGKGEYTEEWREKTPNGCIGLRRDDQNDQIWAVPYVVFNDPDWFQPIDDKPERYRNKKGNYWSIDYVVGPVLRFDHCSEDDDELYDFGNYFRTEAQAEKAAEAIRAVLKYIQTPANNAFAISPYVTKVDAARKAVQESKQ